MQVNRLFEMIYILLGRESVTAKELAERFEVSTRTIYRDLDILSSAGIPIYTSKGSGGGIRLLESFTLDKSLLSKEEQSEILMGLQVLKGARYPDTQEVISKIGSLFNKSEYDWIEVDFSGWGSNKEEQERFKTIKQAIIEEKMISFEYLSSYGVKTLRTVAPIRLVFKGQSWYVQAYCKLKEDYRTFKLMRIRHLKCIDERFQRREFKVGSIEPQSIEHTPSITVKLRFEFYMAFRVYDQFAEEAITYQEDGSIEVTVSYPEGEWIYSYILSFGSAVTVVEPKEVRDKITYMLEETLKKYKEFLK